MGADFDYVEAFSKLDLDAVKADSAHVMTDSRTGGPQIMDIMVACSFYGMAFGGTYRTCGGGGAGSGQRFAFEFLAGQRQPH